MMLGIRDGMEDHELCLLLKRMVGLGSQYGLDVSNEAEALIVPTALVSGVSASEVLHERLLMGDPVALRAQWLAVVNAITVLRTKLSNAGVALV